MRITLAVFLTTFYVLARGQISCRKYTCDGGELLPGTVCMGYNSTEDMYVLSPCDPTTTTCPNPAQWGDQHIVKCVNWGSRKAFSADTYEDYYDSLLVMNIGDPCDQLGILSLCDYNNNLVCQCPNGNCTCTDGIADGGNCTDGSVPCIPGDVCSNGVCVQMYTLLPGASASDERACEGGGPLLSNYFSSNCRATSKTVGGIPHLCNSDTDCRGSDGTYSRCIFGLNTENQAYCNLHFNDDPMVQYRYAFNNYVYRDSVYWYFVITNYPYIQGTVPDCLRNVWRDYGEYKRDLSSAELLLLSALFIAVG